MIEAIDFSPIDQKKVSTQLSLLFGKNVPAEIRVKQFPNYHFTNDSAFLATWSKATYTPIYLGETWLTMNLYTRNCQHFSKWYTEQKL